MVPTIAMTSSMTVDSCPEPPGSPGITKPCAICAARGWARKYTGISSRLPAQNVTAIRSKRRKLPVKAAPTITAAARTTAAILGQAEVAGGQGDADELGDDRQRVEDEQVDDAERAPELAEALQDQPGVPDAGHGTEAQHHLLVHVQHGHQQQQRPQQPGAVVLARLAVGGEGAGVIVAHHHDQPGADDRQQRLEMRGQAAPGRGVVQPDGAERAADVTDVLRVEYRAAALQRRGHGGPSLSPSGGLGRHAASVRAALIRSGLRA